MSFLSQLNWRHATKLFDTTKPVSKNDLETLKQAILMTPTSFGLEPFHVKVVTDQALKDQIQAVSWNQPQVGTCSHLLVFCARTDVKHRIDQYFELASAGDQAVREKMKGYEDMMRGYFADKDEAFVSQWARNQAYIAHGFALAALAELQIDSCPMEGFDAAAVNEILEITEPQTAVVMLPIGYRAEEPAHAKVRYPESDLFS